MPALQTRPFSSHQISSAGGNPRHCRFPRPAADHHHATRVGLLRDPARGLHDNQRRYRDRLRPRIDQPPEHCDPAGGQWSEPRPRSALRASPGKIFTRSCASTCATAEHASRRASRHFRAPRGRDGGVAGQNHGVAGQNRGFPRRHRGVPRQNRCSGGLARSTPLERAGSRRSRAEHPQRCAAPGPPA